MDVDGGAATEVALDISTVFTGASGPMATPVALTAAPGFTGTGLTVNLTATKVHGLQFITGTGQSIHFNAPGGVTVQSDPTVPTGVATKQYVDAKASGGAYVPLAGGTMTGTLNITHSTGITLNAAGSNLIEFSKNGIAPPTLTTRSAGARIVLYGSTTATTTATVATGVGTNLFWFGIPSSTQSFAFYVADKELGRWGNGVFTLGSATSTIGPQLALNAPAGLNSHIRW